MLNIYKIAIQLCRDCVPFIAAIASHDRNLADQLRRAVTSVALNIAESDGQSGGHRRQRRLTALGSAREVHACLEIAEALGYIGAVPAAVTGRMGQVLGTLVNLTRG
jgi:four helix bundle protein